MRPLLITENYPPGRGGMAQSCDRIVRSLRRRGVEFDVAHFGARQDAVHIEQHERGRLISCPRDDDPAHAINLLWSALTRARVVPSHVLAFGGLLPMLCAPSFAAWLRAPLVTLLRGNDFDTGIVSLRRGWMLRDALARSAATCVVSTDHQRRVSALFPDLHVAHIPNGIDADDWTLLEIDRDRAKAWRLAQVPAGRRVVGLFGHLKKKKGGSLLLDALAGCEHAARLHLLVVGDVEPALQQQLQALPEILSWSQVPFLDRMELLSWYAACDAVAIPSLYDGMPNVALEAGALGIPVLGSTAGGLADLLADGNALCFPPGDLHACRRALDLAAVLPEAILREHGQQLQRKVLREFNLHVEARRYHELLLGIAPPQRSEPAAVAAPALLQED